MSEFQDVEHAQFLFNNYRNGTKIRVGGSVNAASPTVWYYAGFTR